MKMIEINGKQYPFHVSPAAAKKLTQMIVERTESTTEKFDKEKGEWKEGGQQVAAMEIVSSQIDLNIETLYLGLKHARLAQPWYKRFYLIPSRKRLEQIIPNDDLDSLLGKEAMPEKTKTEGEEEESEKKH